VLNLEVYPRDPAQRRSTGKEKDALPYDVHECVTFHGVKLYQPDWGYESHSIALGLSGRDVDDDMHIMINAYRKGLVFELPPRPVDSPWLRLVDTSLPSPYDIADPGQEQAVVGTTYRVQARSVAILLAHAHPQKIGSSE
jgi:glycogen operon protein